MESEKTEAILMMVLAKECPCRRKILYFIGVNLLLSNIQ